MKTKLFNFLAIGLGLAGLLFAAPVASAAPSAPLVGMGASLKEDACAGLSSVDSSQGCGADSDKAVTNIVKAIVNILSFIVGITGVIMVVVAGFKYITSSGDSNNISSAKNTLLYALVGLAIAALAQFIVHFTLNSAASGACPDGKVLTAKGVCK
jgi:cytochrome bd-type quinol oxidase subunit 2